VKGKSHAKSLTQDPLSLPVTPSKARKSWSLRPGQAQTEMIMQGGDAIARIPVEARTIRKLKLRIIPFILILYVISFLDRINIGFAKSELDKDLAMASHQFGLAVGIFFIGYALFEIPSNLILHKVGARTWLARILIVWGFVSALTGLVQNVNQLYLARFLLGWAEAGYFPGIILYLTYWFRRPEQAQVLALLLIGIPITSIVGGPLSGLILDHIHWLGLSSWRWLFILEGIPAVIGGVLTYYLLPSRPAEATFLAGDERNWIVHQLEQEAEEKRKTLSVSAARALVNGRVWHLASIGFALGTALFIACFYLPQIVKKLSSGYSNTTVGLLVMVPNIAGLVCMILISRSSDRRRERRWHAAIPACIGGIACLLFGVSHSTILSIALLCLIAVGIYGAAGPFWALPCELLTGFSAASGIALITSIAGLGGFVGPYAVGLIQQRTGSLQSSLDVAGIALLVFAPLLLLLRAREIPQGIDR
jgi:ACS family tartrate transporter-like MFS transporter